MTGELPEFFNEKTSKARKPHKCVECRGVIQPGEIYHLFSGVWSGEFDSYKSCVDCHKLREEMSKGRDCEQWPAFGDLYQEVFESGKAMIERYMAILRKRGGEIMPWMLEREAEDEE